MPYVELTDEDRRNIADFCEVAENAFAKALREFTTQHTLGVYAEAQKRMALASVMREKILRKVK